MLQSRTINNHINNIHERALRLTFKDNHSSFKGLFEKDHSVTVHHKNLQVLFTEIFKVKNELAQLVQLAYIVQLGFIWSAYIHIFMAEPGYILVTIVYLQYDVIMLP